MLNNSVNDVNVFFVRIKGQMIKQGCNCEIGITRLICTQIPFDYAQEPKPQMTLMNSK